MTGEHARRAAGPAQARRDLDPAGIWTLLGVFFAYASPTRWTRGRTGGLAEFLPPALPGRSLAGFPFFGGVFALMLGVFALGSDFGWDTLKTLLTPAAGPAARVCRQAGGARRSCSCPSSSRCSRPAPSRARHRAGSRALPRPAVGLVLLRAMAAGWLSCRVGSARGDARDADPRHVAGDRGRDPLRARRRRARERARRECRGVEPVGEALLRADGYSLATALGRIVAEIGSNGPGSFNGPLARHRPGRRPARGLRRGVRRPGRVAAAPPRRRVGRRPRRPCAPPADGAAPPAVRRRRRGVAGVGVSARAVRRLRRWRRGRRGRRRRRRDLGARPSCHAPWVPPSGVVADARASSPWAWNGHGCRGRGDLAEAGRVALLGLLGVLLRRTASRASCWKSACVLSMNCRQIDAGYVPPDTGEPRHSVSIGLSRSG